MDLPAARDVPTPEVVDHLLAFIAQTSDYVGVTDDEGRVLYVNEATRKRLGLADGTDPLSTADLFPPAAFDIYFEQIRPAVLKGESWSGYVPVYASAGEVVEVWMTVVGEPGPGGEVRWLATLARGMTEWRKTEDELTRRATRDDLTGLARRALLADRLEVALARVARDGGVVAVVFVDVDNLKLVNDLFGHLGGDDVLVEVARRLSGAVRGVDTVARVGGDEFVVLFDGVDDEAEAVVLAERLQHVIEGTPMRAGADVVNVTVSLGLAAAAGDGDADTLMRRADEAMYRAKRRHDRTQSAFVVAAGGERRAPITGHELAVGVTQRSIVAFYQPVIDLTQGGTIGYQALARWSRPGQGVVAAADFLDLADTSALGLAIDLAIIRQGVSDAARWRGPGRPRLYVHVSSRFIAEPRMEYFLSEVLESAHFDADRLFLVIPERTVTRHTPVLVDALAALAQLGVAVVVSEVGAHNSVILDLAEGPFTELRLASALVQGMRDDTVRSRAVAGAIALAHGLGMRAHAVCVETPAQAEHLALLGCDLAEGFLLGSPERTVSSTTD